MKCPYCGQNYVYKGWLLNHIEKMHQEGVVVCEKCKRTVPDSRICMYCGEILDERIKELARSEED